MHDNVDCKSVFQTKISIFPSELSSGFSARRNGEKYKAQKWSERMIIKERKGKKKPVIRQGQV